MRRSRRFSAIEASRQLLNASSESSESDSDSSIDEDLENNSDDEENIEHSNMMEWKFVNAGQDTYDSSTIAFSSESGINSSLVPGDQEANDIDYFFKLFLDDDIFQNLCQWTNKRAEMAFEEVDVEPNGDLPDSISKWHPVSLNEMKKVFGIILCMSLNKKPEIRNYWSRSMISILQNGFFS